MKRTSFFITIVVLAALALIASASSSVAQGSIPSQPSPSQKEGRVGIQAALGTGFTYQGQIKQDGHPVSSTCDLQFGLYDAASLGVQLGVTQTVSSVSVASGLFTVQLNGGSEFGASAFAGDARWLAIAVRCPAGSGSYTSLGRQALTAAPYALYAQRVKGYQNVLVVAKSGGDYTSVQAALTSITTASDTNRYLVWVAPGVYTETVTMKPYVDIEGAGELLTTISYTGSASGNTGTVVGANDAELRFLAVRNTGGNTRAIAIYNNGASPRHTHVTASASGGTTNYGVLNSSSSSPTMNDVTASASGGTTNYGVRNDSSSPTMNNVTASASGGATNTGVHNYSSSAPTIRDSTISASGGTNSFGVSNDSSSSPTIQNSTLRASGATNSYGVYNNGSSSAPTIQNCTISASGATYSYGVYNYSSSAPTIRDSTLSAMGGTGSFGVYNNSSSGLTIQNSTISASDGVTSYGVYNYSSSATTIQNSTLSASGGTSNYGIYNGASGGSYTVKMDSCQVTGSTNTISNDTEFTVRIGASQLDGGAVTGGGTVTCIGAYDENYTSPGYTTCP